MDWVPRRGQYLNIKVPVVEEVKDHPLKPITVANLENNTNSGVRRGTLRSTSTSSSTRTPTPIQTPAQSNDFIDPLTSHSTLDGTDPLSQFAHDELDPLTKMATDEWDYSENMTVVSKKMRDQKSELIEPWSTRRAGILNKYTTTKYLTMSRGQFGRAARPGSKLPEKVKNHSEQLDDIDEDSTVKQTETMSQQKFTVRLAQLNSDLVQAWNSDQRVKALKIAIQAAKLLSDTSGMEFYPSKFVLVTDILDNFGQLVYDRLKMKSECPKPGSKVVRSLPENFSADMIPEAARETCQNWFYKIASIRELVPRLYVELAIIRSYNFLKNSDIPATLMRITRMIRGIGDPLVAVYARCYVCRVGLAVSQVTDFNFVKENFFDFLSVYQQLFSESIKQNVIAQRLFHYQYTDLYMPALEWIIQTISATSSEKDHDDIYERCQKQDNNEALLNVILKAFKPSYIATRDRQIAQWIADCSKNVAYPVHILYRNFGECVLKEGHNYTLICNEVMKYLQSLNDPDKFLTVMEIWVQIVSLHCSYELCKFFIRLIKEKMKSAHEYRAHENCHTQLQTIVEKIVANVGDEQSFLILEEILPLLDLFYKDDIKIEVAKTVLESLSVKTGPITDPIMINNIMSLLKMMHDSISIFTVDDEKRQMSILICSLIQRVDYGRDFEKQLSFYVETRASFANLDSVHMQLVQCVNRLAIDTRKIVRGHHTRRTSSFVRACVAFCFITIPSLTSVRTRLQLYLLSGQVALSNQCLEQADACFKAALTLVPEMPKTIDIDGREKSSEPYVLSYLSCFLSTLLIVPDSPEHGVLYLMRGLLNAAQRWFDDGSPAKWEFYLRVLDLLSVVTQESYPYHVDKIDSNDTFYGSDPKFISEVNKISTKVNTEILNRIKNFGHEEEREKQCNLMFGLALRMIARADLSQTPVAALLVTLLNKSQKYNVIDKKIRARTMEYVMSKNRSPDVQCYVSEYVLVQPVRKN